MFSDGVDTSSSRERIISYLVDNPGSSINKISKDLDIAKATLRYHIDRLRKNGSVFSEKDGTKDIFFTTEGEFIEKKRRRKAPSVHEDRVLRTIRREPGIEKDEMFLRMGLPRSKFNSILRQLKASGMVWEVEKDGKRTFHPVTQEMVLKEMVLDIVELYLDGQIDEKTYSRIKKKIERQRR